MRWKITVLDFTLEMFNLHKFFFPARAGWIGKACRAASLDLCYLNKEHFTPESFNQTRKAAYKIQMKLMFLIIITVSWDNERWC